MSADDRGPAAVALQVAASIALYLLVEADAAKVQALRMRAWHTVKRAAWKVSADAARLGLFAERRYDQVKG